MSRAFLGQYLSIILHIWIFFNAHSYRSTIVLKSVFVHESVRLCRVTRARTEKKPENSLSASKEKALHLNRPIDPSENAKKNLCVNNNT